MRSFARVVVAALALCLLLAGQAWAMRGWEKEGCRRMVSSDPERTDSRMISCLLERKEELAFTGEQETKLRQILFDTQKQLINDKAAIDLAKLELARVQDTAEPDEKQMRKAVDMLYDARRQAAQTGVNRMVALRKILTAEQAAALRERSGCGRFGSPRGGAEGAWRGPHRGLGEPSEKGRGKHCPRATKWDRSEEDALGQKPR